MKRVDNVRNGRDRRGFTLIEILVVISIIIILVGTVLAVGTQMRANAQVKQTRATLQALNSALIAYMADGNAEPNGADPTIALSGQLGTAIIFTQFVADLQSSASSKKVILSLPMASYGAGGRSINDGFGYAILYMKSNTATGRAGYFQSAGADGVMGTGDDLFSYDP